MRRLEDFDVLILPGVGGAGPDHWQTFWQRAFPSFRRVLQDNWELPVYGDWALRLSDAVNAAKKPVMLVGHSLGTCLTVRWANENPTLARKVVGAFLVATTDIDRFEGKGGTPATGFAPIILEPLPFPALIVASHNDERVSFERASEFANAWGATLADVGDAGHIGSAAKLGVWPTGLVLLGQFIATLNAAQGNTSA